MNALLERLRAPLLAWPGRLETPGLVKRRLLLVATIGALALSAAYGASGEAAPAPFFGRELRDMAGLPEPPARFAPTDDGDIRRLSPEEYGQLQKIKRLIERFPVPDAFVDQGERPRRGRAEGGRRG